MYLEEHVEQTDQEVAILDQQIDIMSKGLADLTTDVRAIRHDQTEGLKQLTDRFDQPEQRFDK